MSILNKLAFWKKHDLGLDDIDKTLGIDDAPHAGNALPDLGAQNAQGYGQDYDMMRQQMDPFHSSMDNQPRAFQQMQQGGSRIDEKDLEIIASKLDAIRVAIDNISQRLANLERYAYSDDTGSQRIRSFYRDMPPRTY
jgi:hypothetical protein